MKARLVAIGAAALLSIVPSAFAHRVDEYLQAIILSVENDRIRADMFLTAGMAVAPLVLADIDTDSNGVVSEAEQRVYSTRVLDGLSITLNGARLKPRLVSMEFPNVDDMKEGLGDIHLEFQVDLPRSGPCRKFRLENHHQRRIAVHQVNCLVSRDPNIQLGAQRRDRTKSVYDLDYTQVTNPEQSVTARTPFPPPETNGTR